MLLNVDTVIFKITYKTKEGGCKIGVACHETAWASAVDIDSYITIVI